jgi:hypothetical protein
VRKNRVVHTADSWFRQCQSNCQPPQLRHNSVQEMAQISISLTQLLIQEKNERKTDLGARRRAVVHNEHELTTDN